MSERIQASISFGRGRRNTLSGILAAGLRLPAIGWGTLAKHAGGACAAVAVGMLLCGCASSLPSDEVTTPLTGHATAVPTEVCHPNIDSGRPQYVIGYGSLMQDESRRRTSPHAGPAHPVEVRGFVRGWFAAGSAAGPSTTFLGVAPGAGSINAVVYLIDAAELAETDKRESGYCRELVSAARVTALERTGPSFDDAQAWIYVNRPESTAKPSVRSPIVQSYVDIFLSGCIEQQERYSLPGFAARCVTTTHGWEPHWINDRLYPRRPFIYQPRAAQIDALLTTHVGAVFSNIRIE